MTHLSRMIELDTDDLAIRLHDVDPLEYEDMIKNLWNFLLSVLVLLLVALIATFPATWLLMLFLGNLGLGLSYWGALPLGILIASLIGAAGHNEQWNVFVRTDN
jgi:hypothetical protein